MSHALDAAIEQAHQRTKMPVAPPDEAPRKPVKAGAPAVKVDKSGRRVRLRNIDHALEGTISTRKGEIRYRLEPNQWATVPDEVYVQLRDKFYKPQEFQVTDWNGDLNNPQATPRTDFHQEYIIEFPDEKE